MIQEKLCDRARWIKLGSEVSVKESEGYLMVTSIGTAVQRRQKSHFQIS